MQSSAKLLNLNILSLLISVFCKFLSFILFLIRETKSYEFQLLSRSMTLILFLRAQMIRQLTKTDLPEFDLPMIQTIQELQISTQFKALMLFCFSIESQSQMVHSETTWPMFIKYEYSSTKSGGLFIIFLILKSSLVTASLCRLTVLHMKSTLIWSYWSSQSTEQLMSTTGLDVELGEDGLHCFLFLFWRLFLFYHRNYNLSNSNIEICVHILPINLILYLMIFYEIAQLKFGNIHQLVVQSYQLLKYQNMKKNLSTRFAILIVLLALAYSLDIKVDSAQTNNQQVLQVCDKPLIYEYVSNFTLPLKDVKAVSANQLSKNTINNIAAPSVQIFSIVYESSMIGQSQSETFDGPFQADAVNTNLMFKVTYQMNVSHTLGKNTYNATTNISGINIKYHKAFDSTLGKTVISKVNYTLQPSMMHTSINPAPSKNDTKKIETALTATTGTSLYMSIKTILNPLQQYMNQNAKTEHLSKIFQSNPYSYDYYNYKIDIDASSNSVTVAQDSDVINGVSATIKDATHCSTFVPTFQNGNTFYTFEFIQNMADYTIKTYLPYQAINISKSTIRTSVFQFKLIDLEYVLDNFLDDLGKFYLNEIYFTCKASSIVDGKIDSQNKNIWFAVDWKCGCFVKNATQGKDVQVMDFVPRIKHILQLRASDTLSVYINKLEIVDVQYNTVANYNVVDQRLFKNYMTQTFNEMRRYTIGTFFQLKKGSTKLAFGENNSGIWVA